MLYAALKLLHVLALVFRVGGRRRMAIARNAMAAPGPVTAAVFACIRLALDPRLDRSLREDRMRLGDATPHISTAVPQRVIQRRLA